MIRVFWAMTTAALFVEMLAPLFVVQSALPRFMLRVDPGLVFAAALIFAVAGGLAALVVASPRGIQQLYDYSGRAPNEFRRYYDATVISALLLSDAAVVCAALGAIMLATPVLVLPSVIVGLLLNVIAFPNIPRALRLLGERQT